jgi:hypothetical protein
VWVVRELVRVVTRVVIGVSIAVVVGALLALISGNSFAGGLHVVSLVLGCLVLLMGVMGSGSNFDRAMDFGVTQAAWGRIPGMSTTKRTGEDPTLRPGIVLVLTGLAILAFGIFVAQ